ncbi:unnamed protein product [Adineta steineri]|uniref:G-protein coupled receptors family 1 profile domain-containing protein n=1 Tax=Adineta steineri TaxID=433720 RepID=A0A814MST7_9BILA|nr:unnamed protein product [Adineta steineri]CAF3681702.1 unnamed protein product [Adineta steineri]
MAAQTLFVTYYSLTLVIVGTLLSFFTFIILCRLKLRNRRAKSTLCYLRTIAIFDILMLYGWNLDHYLDGIYGFTVQTSSISLCVYNCIPFILMVIFNSGVIYHLIHRHHRTTIRNSRIRHRSITITLITTTFLFLIMTVPATVAFAFFPDGNETILHFLDGILYTYHITSFPLYLITFGKFRREVFVCIKHK